MLLDDEPEQQEGDGYGEEMTCAAATVTAGDLVCLDDGTWVVVDGDPEDDPAAPGCTVISWRSDDDDAGVLSLPEDEIVTVRQPADEDLEVSW